MVVLDQYSEAEGFPNHLLIYNNPYFDMFDIQSAYNISLPSNVIINDYPIVTYFKDITKYVVRKEGDYYANTNINFDISQLELELLSNIDIGNEKYPRIFKYKADLYTIYTFDENFISETEKIRAYNDNILELSYDSELFIDTIGEESKVSNELKQNQSFKVLYDKRYIL